MWFHGQARQIGHMYSVSVTSDARQLGHMHFVSRWLGMIDRTRVLCVSMAGDGREDT